ncbi:MAG: hypothetical protein Q8R92_15905 [Deltaproteobacteria bacterium]|nr:hypothetical protein [Deltaproteobacteria bacterium]
MEVKEHGVDAPHQKLNRAGRGARVLRLLGPAPVELPPTVHPALTRFAVVRRELDLVNALREVET